MQGETAVADDDRRAATAVLAVLDRPATHWVASVASAVATGAEVHVITAEDQDLARELLEPLGAAVSEMSLSEWTTNAGARGWQAVALLLHPVLLPGDAFTSATTICDSDIRIATVSFFSNNANYLTFPDPDRPQAVIDPGWSETTLTSALREAFGEPTDVPIPLPTGAAVVLSTVALRSLGPLRDARPALAVLDFAMRGIRKGFRNVLDPTTYVFRPYFADQTDPLGEAEPRAWLEARHPLLLTAYDEERGRMQTPLRDAARWARAKTYGIRVLVEAATLGPFQMGTQVTLLAQLDALRQHPMVRELVVGTPGGQIPGYAWEVLHHQGVRVCSLDGLSFTGAGHDLDILHRPYQPAGALPWDEWHALAARVVATTHDMIAFENGSYHPTADDWMYYRDSMRISASRLDGMVVITHDVRSMVQKARLPIADDRLYVVENGTDHIGGDLSESFPADLARVGWGAEPFILVLGASYDHKNRDTAIRAWRELRDRGHDVRLVMAGVVVPTGSTRDAEAALMVQGDHPTVIPDVTEPERNWLYRHASLVLYATSAEGFGLVPFEAASFGTPTVWVPFGPLKELLGDAPGTAAEWSPGALADAMATLLTDPAVAAQQVRSTLTDVGRYTWERMGDSLVSVFLDVLSKPALRAQTDSPQEGAQ